MYFSGVVVDIISDFDGAPKDCTWNACFKAPWGNTY